MENNKNKKSVKFQGDMLNFCDFIQVFVFTPNHHLKISRDYCTLYIIRLFTHKAPITTAADDIHKYFLAEDTVLFSSKIKSKKK